MKLMKLTFKREIFTADFCAGYGCSMVAYSTQWRKFHCMDLTYDLNITYAGCQIAHDILDYRKPHAY